MKINLFNTACLILIASLNGCATYYHIDSTSELINPEQFKSSQEITTTPSLSDKIGSFQRIVVSAPQYINQSIATDTTVMKDNTSYWLSEIERQFLSKGYTVLSRQKFEELKREESVRSDEKAADLLGADLIVQINDLSFKPIDLESYVDTQITCYRSDSVDEKGTLLAKGYEQRLPSRLVVPALNPVTHDKPDQVFISELNAKIIDAKTGEIVYFYKDEYSTLAKLELYSIELVLKNSGNSITGYKWKVISTDKKINSIPINNDAMSSSSGESLMKITTARFVTSFIKSQKGIK